MILKAVTIQWARGNTTDQLRDVDGIIGRTRYQFDNFVALVVLAMLTIKYAQRVCCESENDILATSTHHPRTRILKGYGANWRNVEGKSSAHAVLVDIHRRATRHRQFATAGEGKQRVHVTACGGTGGQ